MTNSSSTSPTRQAPIGPWKGMSEIISAAEAPMMAGMSSWFCESDDSAVAMTWTSLR